MENTNSNSSGDIRGDLLLSGINSFSVLVCLIAVVWVFISKLYISAVYRLALYQVLAALAYAVVELLQLPVLAYSTDSDQRDRACKAIGWLSMYCIWVKLLFTMWVTFHLFFFAVLHKDMKKFEALYVVTSLLIPALIAAVPLTVPIASYGYSPVDGCYIPAYNGNYTARIQDAAIERFTLWEGPAVVMLFAASATMFAVVMKLSRTICQRRRYSYDTLSEDDQFTKAFKQILPLAAFPVIFFVFVVPYFVYDVYYTFLTPSPNKGLNVLGFIVPPLWSAAAGLTLVVHMAVVRLPVYCRKLRAKRRTFSAVRTTYASFPAPV